MKTQHIVITVLVCVVGFYFLLTPRHSQIHSRSFETMKRFSKIGNALEKYSWEHDDQLPSKLSELYPQYIGTNELSVFYPSNSKNLPPDWNSNPELMDSFSDCVYLGTSGIPHEVIAYERERDGNANAAKLNILFPHGGGTTLTKQELNSLLSTNDCELLEHFRKEQVTYFEANLHASLNSYRIDFGTYPRGNNAWSCVISLLLLPLLQSAFRLSTFRL